MLADRGLWNTQEFVETATLEEVSTYLDNYEDPNVRNLESDAPLSLATGFNASAVIRALLTAGTDPNARDKDNDTPASGGAIRRRPRHHHRVR